MIDSPLEPFDLASGMVLGSDPAIAPLPPTEALAPRAAMVTLVRAALLRPPCLVSFSGGRDSSAVLALAVKVAHEEGLALPVPATVRFPGDRAAEESSWQDGLLGALGLRECWQREVTTELDLLGPEACAALDRHGLRYPPNAHFHASLFAAAAGGSLLSGVGGDELFEPSTWSRPVRVLAGRAAPRPSDLRGLGALALPRPLRSRLVVRGELQAPPWLSPSGRRELLRRLRAWLGEEPLAFDAHLRSWWWRSRYFHHGHASLELLARDHDVAYVAPFMEAGVLAAIAAERGRLGFASRDEAMAGLFGDLLGVEVVRRATKASFSHPLVGPATRAFAELADPTAVLDEELVDTEALRAAWRQPEVDIRSLLALRACWLARSPSAR